MDASRFDRNRLTEQAIKDTGLFDLGEPSWQEGLDRLLADLVGQARLNDLGVEIALREVVGYLTNRLALTEWRKQHPELATQPIERPIVIIGQPRTGTTILYDLLAQDPQLRAPLSWEVDRPCPPPDPATFESDPRIAEVQAMIELVDSMMPGFTAFHPMGARLAQECVRMTAGDFRSMIFITQYHVPSYNRWLLHEADLAPAYRWHRRYLQHLQSRMPARRWLLKSPAHMWHLAALVAEYPDVVLIQTHRDPLKVVASVSALVAHLRRMASAEASIAGAAATFTDDIFEGLERSIDARESATIAPERVVDVQFSEFLADPLRAIERIYAQLRLELSETCRARMRAFLESHPGDGGGAGTRYTFADTGQDAGELRERARRYQERFGVVSEPIV